VFVRVGKMRNHGAVSKFRIFNTCKEYLLFNAVYKAFDCQVRCCSDRCAATDTNRFVKGKEKTHPTSRLCRLFFIYLSINAKHKHMI
jgi:hypothetical protein